MTSKVLRCAIYTRKSSEEGLEQDFNSLHAQREAGASYIASQKHEGWQAIKTHYDDGGFSGGTMERPALKQLLADIAAGKVDVIVVYKVDRLSRSLHDFAKMVEVFDAHRVSFVSVTQQFNTTTSMGRLTLNVLLSFAQFEREVTGERIRDKIAASKKKGMWMGGAVPLGYKVEERKILPEPEEVKTARYIFTRYLETGCVRLLMQRLRAENVRSRKGQVLSRGALYGMLSNPIYIGKIRHKDIVYDGLHEGIIAEELWDTVQQRLASNRIGTKTRSRKTQACPLTNKLFDASGERLVPVHAFKKGRRYRYYISESLKTATRSDIPSGWRLPGQELEQMVAHVAAQMLQDGNMLTTALQSNSIAPHHIGTILAAAKKINADTPEFIERFVLRVDLRHDGLNVTITLASLLPSEKIIGTEAPSEKSTVPTITRDIPMRMKRRGVEMRLVIGGEWSPPRTDAALIKTIARAHAWFQQLATGHASNIAEIAMREGVDRSYATRILNLAFLAPDIIECIIAGQQPADLNIEQLTKRMDLPVDWAQQRQMLGCM